MSTKFGQLIESIENMTVLELSQLVKSLEEKFGVSAASMAAPAAAVAAVDAAPVEEKTIFKVTLKDAGPDKIKVIKALRTVTSLGLLEAKKTVEDAPVVIAEAVSKDEAAKMKAALEEAKAVVELS